MVRSLPVLAAFGLANTLCAQHYGHIWQFGNDVGLDFHECYPFVITGQNSGFEGCATVCNNNGQLLLYTNSATVWNRQHAPMPNGDLGASNGTLSQVVILQQPENDSLFHIITTTIQGQASGKLEHHVVNLNLMNGLGDVILANQSLYGGISSETVAATRHANGTDIWIMAHAYPENHFLAYLLTANGLNTTPVVSIAGPPYPATNSNMNARGEMKFSVDGTRLAYTGNGTGSEPDSDVLALFQFDNATGQVSAPLILPPSRGDFGLTFSPDGSKLYTSTWKAFNFFSTDTNMIVQFDLSSNDPQTIIDSRMVLHSTLISQPYGALKLGPDGRIYIARYASQYLSVITEPDLAGAACNYVHEGVYLNGAMCFHGLNNYIEYVDCGITTSTDERPASQAPMLFPNPAQEQLFVQGTGVASMELIDMSGRQVLLQRTTNGATVDIRAIAPGLYNAVLRDVNGIVIDQRALAKDR